MIALGCDHGGFELKQEIIAYLKARKIEYKDFGCYDNKSVDYPVYAANKMKGIRAAVCTDCCCAEATRLHNDSNVLALGGRVVGPGLAIKIVDTFLNTEFSGEERHQRRINQIED